MQAPLVVAKSMGMFTTLRMSSRTGLSFMIDAFVQHV
jgi:hypothetical protein